MNTVTYNHFPGDEVYVVLDENTVRKASVLQVDIRVYEREDFVAEDLTYIVLLLRDNDSVRVETDLIFSDVDDALLKVREKFENTLIDVT